MQWIKSYEVLKSKKWVCEKVPFANPVTIIASTLYIGEISTLVYIKHRAHYIVHRNISVDMNIAQGLPCIFNSVPDMIVYCLCTHLQY